MKGKFKLLFTVLSLIGLGLTSCGGSGGEQGGQQGGEQPGGEVTPGGDGGETQHTHTYSGYEHDANQHWQVCTGCHEATAKEDHRGGSATCEHKAVCEVCGAEYGELAAHQYGSLIAKVDPTCTEDGVAAHYQCSVCHKFFTEAKVETTLEGLKIATDGHAYGTLVAAEAADCEHDGHAAYYHCSECNKYFDADKNETTLEALKIAKLGHAYGELIAQVDADCEHTGTKAHYECSRCHKLFNEQKEEVTAEQLVIAPVGHAYGEIVAEVPATCEADGVAAHYHCSECGKYFTSDKEETTLEGLKLPALGHEYGNLIARQDPTCTEDGMEAHYKCSRCNKLFDSDKVEHSENYFVIPALGHNPQAFAASEATCEVAGNSAYYQCSNCDKYFSDEECTHEIAANSWVIEPLGHDGSIHTAAVAATCTTAGNSEYWECSVCHKYFADAACNTEIAANSWVIPATGHTPVHHEANAATCAEAGNSEYWECSVCHHYFSNSECTTEISENSWVIPATGAHTFDVDYPEIRTFATYRHAYHHCSVCDKLFIDNGAGGYTKIDSEDDAWENSLNQYQDPEFVNSESNPYLVSGLPDLLLMRNAANNTAVNDNGTPDDTTDDIPLNDTFAGKYFFMTNNIDLTGTTDLSPIGDHDNRPFSGIFDGDNHSIIGFKYSGTNILGLFSRVTNGTIKNLRMYGVDITNKASQRQAAIVGRGNNVMIDNCHVASGSIVGKAQSGGIAAFIMGTSTIQNCTNAADINGSGNIAGGILGCTHTDTTTKTIKNCINYGNVTGGGDSVGGIIGGGTVTGTTIHINDCINRGVVTGNGVGAGGIIGATGGGGTAVTVMKDCLNEAAIHGKTYVGGIAGILREGNKDNSLISDCVNKGDIIADTSSTAGFGGICGIARVNVADCGCLATATVRTAAASTFNAVGSTVSGATGAGGIPGFIAGTVGNDATASGYLVYEYTVTSSGTVGNIFADDAQIFAWAWGGAVADTGDWYKAYKSGTNEVKVYLPIDAEGFKLARFAPNVEPVWDSEWNQSSNATIEADVYTYSVTM